MPAISKSESSIFNPFCLNSAAIVAAIKSEARVVGIMLNFEIKEINKSNSFFDFLL